MKKSIALLLAIVLVFGMATVVSAAPAGYTEIEYVESDGVDDYIDLGFAPDGYDKVVAEMEVLDSGKAFLLGVTVNDGTEWKQNTNVSDTLSYGLMVEDGLYHPMYSLYPRDLDKEGNKSTWFFANKGTTASAAGEQVYAADQGYGVADTPRFTVELNDFLGYNSGYKVTSKMTNGAGQTLDIKAKTATVMLETGMVSKGHSMYLFARNKIVPDSKGASGFAKARVYSLKIYDGTAGDETISFKLAADLKPVMAADGTVGLLDNVTGKFFSNSGSGNLIAPASAAPSTPAEPVVIAPAPTTPAEPVVIAPAPTTPAEPVVIAPTPAAPAAAGTKYTVKDGDCLYAIARNLMGSGTKWGALYEANKAVIGSDPRLIYTGTVLTIPG